MVMLKKLVARIRSKLGAAYFIISDKYVPKWFYRLSWPVRLFARKPWIGRLRKKETIKVLFICQTPAMWKADSLYRAMLKHVRFEPEIYIVPPAACKTKAERGRQLISLRNFFDKKGYHYVEWINDEGIAVSSRLPREYDILIYPQPWPYSVPKVVDFKRHTDRWFICSEYSFHLGIQNWAYNKWYQNVALVDCYENDTTWKHSCKEKYNRGMNSVVTGLPFMDEFSRTEYKSPWKPQPTPVKKIIWAPHWTIQENISSLPSYSNFLIMAEYMLHFAQKTEGKLQFVFKPHPWLKMHLYKHTGWGQERTDAYYAAWENGNNTQLEEGDYVDLFMTSDAMVHDSCSFCCEYMLTGNPVLFMAKNEERQTSLFNKMGYDAFYAQYIGKSLEDICVFIENNVLGEEDPLKKRREEVVEKYLTPPRGLSAAENIINAILGA